MEHKKLAPQDSHSPSQERIENNSGGTIPALRCVTYNAIGTLYADATLAQPGDDVRGLTNGAVSNGQSGFIMVYGPMYNVDTSAWAPGTSLYCDTDGALTTVSNGFPQVANVLKQHATLGVLQVTCLDTPAAMSVAVTDSDSIELDTIGSSISADLRLSSDPAAAENLKATTVVKSTGSKGLHIQYPYAKADTDGVLKKEDWATFNSKVPLNDPRLSTQNILNVKKNPGTGEYATIADALGAIVNPSETNRYLIKVGPGIYDETELIVPPYVSISGASINSTVVRPQVGEQNLFVMSAGAELSFMSLEGHADSIGSGFPAILCEDVGDFAQFHKMSIYDFDIGFRVLSVAAESIAYLEYVDVNGDYSYAVHATSTNGFFVRCQIENFYTYETNSATKTAILCEGPDSELLLHVVGLIGSTTGGKGVVLRDGASAEVSATFLHDFGDAAIITENIGAAPRIEISGSSFKNCTKDLKINHPGTLGFFEGYAEAALVELDPAAPFFITGKDAQILTVAKEGGDYTSINTALASIIDNSPSKAYIISVGPGLFIEDTIVGKPNVAIIGSGTGSTIIQVDDVNKNIIEADTAFAVKHLTLQGATGTGKAAVLIQPTTLGESVLITDVEFGDNYTFVKLSSNLVVPSTVDVSDVTSTRGVDVVEGFVCESTGGGQTILSVNNYQALLQNAIDDLFMGFGPGAFLILTNISAQSISGGNFSRFYDGARFVGRNIASEGFVTGIEIENVGAPSSMQVLSSIFISTTNDMLISHPGASGSFQGQADNQKITVDPASPLRMNYVDAIDPTIGTIVLGDVLQGDRHDRLLSVSKLIRQTAPVGTYEGGEISLVSGLDISVTAGNGFLIDSVSEFMKEVSWDETEISIPGNADHYVYVNSSGVVTSSMSEPNPLQNLILGRVSSFASVIHFIDKSSYRSNQLPTRIEQYQREAIGSIFSAGSIVTENGTRGLSASSGVYYFGNTKFSPSGGTGITWGFHYRNGSGGYTSGTQTTVNNTQYDDGSGTLASLTASNYAKHALYVSGDGAEEKYHLVFSQAQYSSLVQAEAGDIPTPPISFKDGVVLIASIIVQQGAANIIQIRDERPIIGFKASGVSASATHGNLLGLGADDHPQYLLGSGARAMTGGLNMGGNAISAVATVNGVTVEGHAARHLPNGADPIQTGAPGANINATATNGVGIANSLSRADHRHGVDTGPAATQTPDQSNATGTSANLARADHVHNIPTDAAIGINAASNNTQGASSAFSRADHTHAIATGVASTQTPDQTNAAGSSSNLARADHTHNIPTAAPSTINADGMNSQGAAATFSRADHKHNVATGVPSTQIPDQINTEGSSSNLARADHTHNIPAGTPSTTLSPSTSNAKGSAQSVALSDHTHAVATGIVTDITAIQPNDTSLAGTTARFARADHRHSIATAAPSTTLSPATSNAEGAGTSFSRADHTHSIATAVAGNISSIQPNDAAGAGVSNTFARGDHKHSIATGVASGINTSSTNSEGASTSFARADHTHAVAITNSEVSSTTSATTTSTTNVLMTGMTITPTAGTYLVVFSCSTTSSSNGAEVGLAIFSGGTLIAHTDRLGTPRAPTVGAASDAATISTNAIVTVNGSQAIEIRWRTTAGTATVGERTMNLIKVG